MVCECARLDCFVSLHIYMTYVYSYVPTQAGINKRSFAKYKKCHLTNSSITTVHCYYYFTTDRGDNCNGAVKNY